MNKHKSKTLIVPSLLKMPSRSISVFSMFMLLVMLLNPIAALRVSASSDRQSPPLSDISANLLDIENFPRPLDIESRLICRRAIEEVYWDHRIWPSENPGPKPALEQMLSDEALRTIVEDELRRSQALEELWQYRITGAQLQSEIDRMSKSTRQPQVLFEIFAALDNDPYLVAECLARPVLSERLLYNFYADAQLSNLDYDSWWQQESGRFSTDISTPEYPYQLSALAQIQAQDNTWTPTPALPEGVYGSTAVWTGIEMIVWGGSTNFGSRYNPATDTWTTMATLNAPSPRRLHTAVWSGSEMIVWGGCDQNTEFCDVSSGGRYDPLTDSWTATNHPDAPVSRMNHTAVWTGSQMIVWAGCSIGSQGNNYCNIQRNDGGVYDPSTDSWMDMSLAGAPDAREYHRAVWADGVMVIWGGYNLTAVNSGGRYDPVANTWQSTSTAGAPEARANHSMVWTGSEVIVWGGCNISLCIPGYTFYNTGGRYDPVSNTWTATTTIGAPEARGHHTAVWTGSEMIIWGGRTNIGTYLDTGSRYDPNTDTWTATGTTGAPAGKSGHHAIWTGNEMIVWGGSTESGMGKTGGRYDPDTDSWVPTNTNDPVFAKERHTAVWTGTEMLVWGGSTRGYGEFFGLGIRYDAVTGSWSLMNTTNEPEGRYFHNAVWTGSEMIVWGGHYGTYVFNSGGRYDPITDSWTDTSLVGSPSERTYHAAVWTGSEMLVWGGATNNDFFTNSGDRYDPSTDTWTPMSTSGAPSARAYLRGVWSGSEMIVWGGYGGTGDTNTGGRYDPVSNSWTSTNTSGAPNGRHFNTAIWTGLEMIVWGGMSGNLDNGTWYNTGGRYDPVSNSWSATSTSGAPSPRIWHVDVWTGEELIVWGGCSGSSSCPNTVYTGGRYNLSSDSWTETSIQSMPSERSNASAIWTGSEMIVWAGMAGNVGTYTTTGGIYHVSTIPNNPPVASPDSYIADEDMVLSVPAPGVLGNDIDEDGDLLFAVLVSNPIHGTLDLNADGSFTYTPDQDFNGSDSFSYRAWDGQVQSDITSVSLSIGAVNDAPNAADDAANTEEDSPVSIAVLENDVDDSPVLTIVAVGIPDLGTAVISGTSVLYTPSANIYGSDSFTYTVSDGMLLDTALVTMGIMPVNDAPVAVEDAYTLLQDTDLVVPAPGLLANDSDIDGDELTAVLVAQPLHGSLTLNADGSFIYSPDAGYSGTDQFTYQARDGEVFSEVTTVSITIEAAPDPGINIIFYIPFVRK